MSNGNNGVLSWRIYLVWFVMAIALAALLARLMYIQLKQDQGGREFLQKQGEMRVVRTESIAASRGKIVDRNGKLLAYSTPVKSVWVDPALFGENESNVNVLAKSLGMTALELKKRLSSNKHYVFLRRQLDPEIANKVMALKLPGVHAKTEYKRYYPAAEFASHIVGFTSVEDEGQEGIELAFDKTLTGSEGRRKVMRNAIGETIKHIRLLEPAVEGGSLSLSIDMNLQYTAYRELKAAVQEHAARSGSMVILDVQTGEVLALVNQPSYNVNDRAQLLPALTRNRAMIDVFEPGSTVKPFTIAAALESGSAAMSTTIDTSPGYIRLGSKTILDPKNYGVLDITSVLVKSSQVGTTKLALDMDAEDLREMFSRVGFGEYCATGFPGEQVGFLPHHKRWQPVEQATLSYGHGMQVNAMQLARAYSVLAANGVKRPVTLLKRQATDSLAEVAGNNFSLESIKAEQVLDPLLAQQIRQMMVEVVERGTGKAAKIAGYSVAGKTGTSHKVGRGGYEENRYRATFAGMIPATNPRLVAVVTINDPQGRRYFGGEIAAPTFAKVMQAAVRLFNIDPDRPNELGQYSLQEKNSINDKSNDSVMGGYSASNRSAVNSAVDGSGIGSLDVVVDEAA